MSSSSQCQNCDKRRTWLELSLCTGGFCFVYTGTVIDRYGLALAWNT